VAKAVQGGGRIIEEQITTCGSNHPDTTTPHREECGAAKEADGIE